MKKKSLIVLIVLMLLSVTTITVIASPPPDKLNCTKIQDGVLEYASGHFLEGHLLMVGYDIYGYNYQAHLFNGSYANVYLGRYGFPPYTGDDDAYLADNPTAENTWYWPYRDIQLLMKWNQDWIANVDCDNDGKLDRHFGYTSYIDSGAWETNHMWGSYEDLDGKTCNWDYFTKIIAVPDDAELLSDYWYSTDGTEIGPEIWGQFATIQTVENDPCAGIHGMQYVSPDHPGFGGW